MGLDPQTRLSLWEILRALHNEGRTIVMTTRYMEEADKLCDRIAIVDGRRRERRRCRDQCQSHRTEPRDVVRLTHREET